MSKWVLFILKIGEEKADKKVTESYTGGEKSGMAVENPDDILGAIEKAKSNSSKYKDEPRDKPDVEVRVTLY